MQDVAYGALAQAPRRELKLVVRTHGAPGALLASIRDARLDLSDRVALGDIRTMEDVKALSLTGASQPAWVIGTFAGLAALLAALGLYGVPAHAVQQQHRALGIRLALGARRRDVGAGVLRQSLLILAGGLAAGAVCVALLGRLVRSMLYEVSPLDPVALGVAGLCVLLLGTLAAALPAIRASRVDPATVLRSES